MNFWKCERIQASVVDTALASERKENLTWFLRAKGYQASWENSREGSLISEDLIC